MDKTFPPIAPAESAPDIAENGGNTGSTGYTAPEPAEFGHFDAAEPVSPAHGATGYTGCADSFASLTDADRARASHIPSGGGAADDDDELSMMPFPGEVPPLSFFQFGNLPIPSQIWTYRTADGAPVVVAARYNGTAADGTPTKDVRPWTHGRRVWTGRDGKKQDRIGWHCKAPPSPRPLYGLDRLATRPDAPVVICEGEKAADAAGLLFPDFIAVASQGGSKAPGKSHWMPLKGRIVTIWPDNDEAGMHYSEAAVELARQAGAVMVRIVEVPTEWPEGWDLADDLPDGVMPERLRLMLEDAPDDAAAEFPPGYRMTREGLFCLPKPTKKNPDPKSIFIASPFRIVGETRSDAGDNWGLLLCWRDRDGMPHQWLIPRRLIHRSGGEIAEELEHAGLRCGPDLRAHDLLKRFIGALKVTRRMRCVIRTGWHLGEGAPVFVLPGGDAFGHGAADMILQVGNARADSAYRSAGTLPDWQRDVAALAVGSDRLVLFLSAAFTGPLLDVLGYSSGGFHSVGQSRTGKSTAAAMAASVWGKPKADAQLRSWRGTANGLEAVAAGTSDTLLVLDEIGQADGREVGDVVYMLANESGKQRASRTGTARAQHSWRVSYLSTGETTLAQKMGEAGKRPAAGLEARLINLPADAGAGMGIFQNLHGHPSPAALAEALRDGMRANHGTAAREFLARLAHDRACNADELQDVLRALRDRFLAEHVPAEADGQVRDVASRFALAGAAGELARDYGVLPWPEGEAMRAAGACFEAWLAQRGGAGPAEDRAAIAQVRAFLEAHGESRFTPIPGKGETPEATGTSRTINRAGWRRRIPGASGDEWEYLILPEAWKTDVCCGLDPRCTAALLASHGWLLGSDERHRADTVRIPHEGSRRVYRISSAIMGDDGAF